MKPKHLIYLLVISSMFYSCCTTFDCDPETLTPGLISFSTSEIDTIVIRRFKTATNFQELVDSLYIVNPYVPNRYTKGDTTYLNFANYDLFNMRPGYDYEIFIPGVNRLVKIIDMKYKATVQESCAISDGGLKLCYSPITSFVADGKLISNQLLYITK